MTKDIVQNVHENNILNAGEIGTIVEISSEDSKGEIPLYYVRFAPVNGYNINRNHWLYSNEIELVLE